MRSAVLLAASLVCLFALALPARGQSAPASSTNALSTWLRNAYTSRKNDLIKSAENVPDSLYNLRP